MDRLAWTLVLAAVGLVIALVAVSAVGDVSAQSSYPTLTVENGAVTEGDSGTENLSFTVTLSPPSDQRVTVEVNTGPSDSDIKARTDHSRPGGPDYEAVTGLVLTFEAGETEKTVDVVVYGDTTDEPNWEGFKLELSNAVNAEIGAASAYGYIGDNDPPPQLTVHGQTITEGDSGSKIVTFTASISEPSGKEVIFYVDVVAGTATEGEDYRVPIWITQVLDVQVPGTPHVGSDVPEIEDLTFRDPQNPRPQQQIISGRRFQTQKTFHVVVLGDTLVEGDETFRVEVSNHTDSILADDSITATIIDDDIGASITLSATTTDQSVHLTWDLPVTGYIYDMDVERLDDQDQVEWGTTVASDQDGDEPTTWSQSDYHFLVAGTTYRYRVKLDTQDYGVVYSDVLEATTQSDAPAAPTGLGATATQDTVSLSWTVPEQPAWVDGPVDLTVMRSRSGGKTLKVGSVPWQQGVTDYSFTDAGLWAGQPYRYFIRALMGGRYHYSAEVSITTAVQPDDPDGTREGAIALDAAAAAGGLQNLRGYSLNRNGGDSVDCYTFTTTTRYQLIFGVWRIRGEGNDSVRRGVTLEDAQGNTVLASSSPPEGATRESLETAIAPGTYYVRVEAMEDAPFSYFILFGLEPPPFTGFSLLDASTQTVLATLTDGAAVELADPDGGSYAIRAEVHPDASVGSVLLELSGAKTVSQREYYFPYSLYGDDGENALHGEALPEGSYVLRATSYSSRLGGMQLAETAQVSFTVSRPNTAPAFGSATYGFSVAEDAATGAAVGAVSATDADDDSLTYTITAGNEAGAFAIDGGTGAISTAAALDYETTPSYALTVQADDGRGGTAAATVTVTVTDVEEDPDATREGAVSLGNQSPDRGRQYFYDKSLDRANGDGVDYYSFTTDARYALGLGVRDQGIELKVTLEDADGNEVGIAGPPSDPDIDQVYIEWLKTTLDAGTYYVRVEALEDGATDYYIRFALETPPPGAPTDVAVYDFTSGYLDIRWSSADFEATDEFKVQWKSGDQEYDASRQVLVGPTGALVPESSTETKRRYMHGISGLVDGTEYTVRVIAANEHGDSVPSSDATGTPSSSPGQARSFFQNELIDIHGDAHPWLRQIWSYLIENDVDVAFARNRNQVAFSCSSSGNSGHECSVDEVVVDRRFVSRSVQVLTHELAHAFTIGTGVADEPAPVAIGFIYFKKFRGKLEIPQRYDYRCNEAELYADALTMAVHTELPLSSLTYWSECVGDDADRTEEALTVVRSVLAGEMPSWFVDTYHDTTGEPDLDALWSDVGTVRYDIGAVANLRDAFGGYCNGETDWPGNPWVGNDGCPPKFGRHYSLTMVDDAAVGASVVSVSATDLDGDTLTYSITGGNDDGVFAIDETSGDITLAGTLDYDTTSYYRLIVHADDGNGPAGAGWVFVTVRAADERPPVFRSSTTRTAIAESQPANSDVIWVTATDPNGDPLTYSIEAGNDDGTFTIRTVKSSTLGDYGVITTAGTLDYETTSSYALTVQADDGNGGTATATVTITVTNVVEPSEGPLAGFTLLDASDQSALATLGGGVEVALADPDNDSYAIRVDLVDGETVGSVRLALSGAKSVTRTENAAPYSLYGDDGEDALHGEGLPAGSYTMTATAYSERDLGGDELGTLEMSFTVAAAIAPAVSYRGQLAEVFLELTRSTFDGRAAQTVGKAGGGLVRGATDDATTTSIVYVVDDSGSMDADFPEVRTALQAVADEVMDNTKVALIAFGTSYKSKTLFGLTSHASAPWSSHIGSFGSKLGGTNYAAALRLAAGELVRDRADTRKIIFFTDGQNDYPEREVTALKAAGIVVDTIAFGDHFTNGFEDLERIATATGGSYREVTPPSEGTTNDPAKTAKTLTNILKGTVAENTATLFVLDTTNSTASINSASYVPLRSAWTTAGSTTGAQLGFATFHSVGSNSQYQVKSPIGSDNLRFSFGHGWTDIDDALTRAFTTASAASTTAKRVVLITDGISATDVKTATLDKYKDDSNVTLYVVAWGAHADRVQLKTWADAASGTFEVAE